VDENANTPWTQVIKDAVKEFISAVADSSNQLAGAAEKFATNSMHTIDEAAARAERSASSSAAMAQIAEKAAEDARLAANSLQSAVNEASERIRSEASEGAAVQLAQVQEAGERLRTDLQGHVDEMISRMTVAAGTNQDAIAAAEAATNAAREAADRVQQSVSAVEAAVANAQRAADEARAAAERSESSSGSIREAVSAAQNAAEASRQSAERAGMQSSVLGGEANMLLERLETDYDLLTRLVRELHSRIASLSLPSVPSTEAAPSEETTQDVEPATEAPMALETRSDDGWAVPEVPLEASGELESSYWPNTNDQNKVWEPAAQEPVTETPIDAPALEDAPVTPSNYWPDVNDELAAWDVPAPEVATEPEAAADPLPEGMPETGYLPHMNDENPVWDTAGLEPEASAEAQDGEPAVEETSSYAWTSVEPAAEILEAGYEAPAYESPRFEPPVPMTQETSVQPVIEAEPAVLPGAEAAPIEVSVSGRVQVTFSPVPDFDRLLNLDGALGRVSGVDSVTLADYAQEEVTFRVEVLGEKDAGLFTREIAVAAGIEATLVDAAGNGLVIRIN
jgi:hypothetical protein